MTFYASRSHIWAVHIYMSFGSEVVITKLSVVLQLFITSAVLAVALYACHVAVTSRHCVKTTEQIKLFWHETFFHLSYSVL